MNFEKDEIDHIEEIDDMKISNEDTVNADKSIELHDSKSSIPMDISTIKNTDPYFQNLSDNMKMNTEMMNIYENYTILKERGREKEAQTQTKILTDKFKKMMNTKEFQRIHEISVRVDTVEKHEIEERSKSYGFKSVSEYIRFVALNSKPEVTFIK
jgi:hypothetical protein